VTDVARRGTLTPIAVPIIVLTLITAGIHAMLSTRAPGTSGLMFLVCAIGYVVLLVLAYAPIPALAGRRVLFRSLLAVWTVGTIIAWAISGMGRNTLGYTDKFLEVVLAVLLVLDIRRSRVG
jgi:hypothetical protein